MPSNYDIALGKLEVNLTYEGSPQLQDIAHTTSHFYHSIELHLCVLKVPIRDEYNT